MHCILSFLEGLRALVQAPGDVIFLLIVDNLHTQMRKDMRRELQVGLRGII